MSRPHLAVFPDFPEEQWPSMDLCAEMLLKELGPLSNQITVQRVCPSYRHHFKWLPVARKQGILKNFDRLLNRMRRYPIFARAQTGHFDLFHICDHSYSQLIHALPAERCGVLCHDLDTFRCLLDPDAEPRPRWFIRMMQTVLAGLKKAAVVFYTTQAVRSQIEQYELVDSRKLVQVPLGIAGEYTPAGSTTDLPQPYVLHVGSGIPRKRVDVLLDVMAGLVKRVPGLRLEQVGGDWTAGQQHQIDRLGIGSVIRQRRGLSRQEVASLYRGAAAVLVTSEAEGFGLPVVEALACGANVVASDLPVLREVGGPAAAYCRVADVPIWVDITAKLIEHPQLASPMAMKAQQAARYSWRRHAEVIADTYAAMADRLGARR